MNTPQPQWQPISMLPVYADMVEGMLEAALSVLENLRQAKDRPHVVDDATLHRVIELHSAQLKDHWLFEEQFARWKRARLSNEQVQEVDRLARQSTRLKDTNEEILQLAQQLRESTIDKIMAMDDSELALAVLSGKLKSPL